MATGGRPKRGVIAFAAAILAFGAAIVLHHVRFIIDATKGTVAQWDARCRAAAGGLGPPLSGAARSRCGEVSLTDHATAGLVVLAAVLGITGAMLVRARPGQVLADSDAGQADPVSPPALR